MIRWRDLSVIAILLLGGLLASCSQSPTEGRSPTAPGDVAALDHASDGPTASLAQPEVFATGLINPRGLEWGPDGYLYVAEGGPGGDRSSDGECEQVIPPIGPYTGSLTGGRISRISPTGERTTLVDDLPSAQTSPESGSLVSGVADVTFLDGQLYALLAGAGCSHAVPELPNAVVKVEMDGSWSVTADLSDYLSTHPVEHPEEEDFEPDGSWYNMVALNGNLYAIEANHGELVKVTPGGRVSRVIDISADYGHIVPTALAYHGNFYVGNLNPFPIVDGSSIILKITPGGRSMVWATGLTTVLGLETDRQGRLYVLENTTGNPFPTPGTGKVLRIDHQGNQETLVEGLDVPTGMAFGPDGMLYISNVGFGAPPVGAGQVLRVDVGR